MKSTYMQDLEAQLSTLIAALSPEAQAKVTAFFRMKMASSYRNGLKAGKPEVSETSAETTTGA